MVPLPNETGASCKLEVLSGLKDQNGLLGELKYSYKQTNSKLIGEGKHGSNNIWTEEKKSEQEVRVVNNLDYYPAPFLPEVVPELEVPELLSEVPLCLNEPDLISCQPRICGHEPCYFTTNTRRAEDKVPWRDARLKQSSKWSTVESQERIKDVGFKELLEAENFVEYDTINQHCQSSTTEGISTKFNMTKPIWTQRSTRKEDGNTTQKDELSNRCDKESLKKEGSPHQSPFDNQCRLLSDIYQSENGNQWNHRVNTQSRPYNRHRAANNDHKRRKRTVFSAAEMAILDGVYQDSKFLNPTIKGRILDNLKLPSNVVVMWFQNRRAKDRRKGIGV